MYVAYTLINVRARMSQSEIVWAGPTEIATVTQQLQLHTPDGSDRSRSGSFTS